MSTRTRGGAMSATATVLAIGVFAVVNYLGMTYYAKWDWTGERLFTLSGRTVSVLKALRDEVKVYVFLAQGEPNRVELQELLDRYRGAQNRLVYRFVDPDRQRVEYDQLAQRFGLLAAQDEQTGEVRSDVAVVVTRGDKRWNILRDDLTALDTESLGGSSEPKVDVKAEQALTGAIVQVTRGRATKVCVTRGHGEWSLGGGQRSLEAFVEVLRSENVEVEAVDVLGQSALGAGCDSVFVLGPQQAWNEKEAGLLGDYLRKGGRVLMTLDPVVGEAGFEISGLEGVLGGFGVTPGNNVVVELEESRLLTPSPVDAFFVNDFGDAPVHSVVSAIAARDRRVMLRYARSISASMPNARAILRASSKSYAESHPEDLSDASGKLAPGQGDLAGPVGLAVAATIDGTGGVTGRLLVIGESNWLAPESLGDQRFANYDLLAASLGWLAERKELISIAPKKIAAVPILISEGDLAGIALRVLLLLPLSIVFLGMSVYWSRRT